MFRLIERAYGLAIAVLLTGVVFGLRELTPWAVAIGAFQLAHVASRASDAMSLSVQVRITSVLMLLAGAWPPLALVHGMLFVAVWTMLLTEYCVLSRCLSLAPWNRRTPLTRALVRQAFLSAPHEGGVLQG
jgi:hypothetical protein